MAARGWGNAGGCRGDTVSPDVAASCRRPVLACGRVGASIRPQFGPAVLPSSSAQQFGPEEVKWFVTCWPCG